VVFVLGKPEVSSREIVPVGVSPCDGAAAVQFPEDQGVGDDVGDPDLQCRQQERSPVAAAGSGQQNDELDQGGAVGGYEEECLTRG